MADEYDNKPMPGEDPVTYRARRKAALAHARGEGPDPNPGGFEAAKERVAQQHGSWNAGKKKVDLDTAVATADEEERARKAGSKKSPGIKQFSDADKAKMAAADSELAGLKGKDLKAVGETRQKLAAASVGRKTVDIEDITTRQNKSAEEQEEAGKAANASAHTALRSSADGGGRAVGGGDADASIVAGRGIGEVKESGPQLGGRKSGFDWSAKSGPEDRPAVQGTLFGAKEYQGTPGQTAKSRYINQPRAVDAADEARASRGPGMSTDVPLWGHETSPQMAPPPGQAAREKAAAASRKNGKNGPKSAPAPAPKKEAPAPAARTAPTAGERISTGMEPERGVFSTQRGAELHAATSRLGGGNYSKMSDKPVSVPSGNGGTAVVKAAANPAPVAPTPASNATPAAPSAPTAQPSAGGRFAKPEGTKGMLYGAQPEGMPRPRLGSDFAALNGKPADAQRAKYAAHIAGGGSYESYHAERDAAKSAKSSPAAPVAATPSAPAPVPNVGAPPAGDGTKPAARARSNAKPVVVDEGISAPAGAAAHVSAQQVAQTGTTGSSLSGAGSAPAETAGPAMAPARPSREGRSGGAGAGVHVTGDNNSNIGNSYNNTYNYHVVHGDNYGYNGDIGGRGAGSGGSGGNRGSGASGGGSAHTGKGTHGDIWYNDAHGHHSLAETSNVLSGRTDITGKRTREHTAPGVSPNGGVQKPLAGSPRSSANNGGQAPAAQGTGTNMNQQLQHVQVQHPASGIGTAGYGQPKTQTP